MGDWSYYNTDGFGLYEQLVWVEDLGAIGIMAVYGGYSLEGENVAEADLAPYVQTALDQVRFFSFSSHFVGLYADLFFLLDDISFTF